MFLALPAIFFGSPTGQNTSLGNPQRLARRWAASAIGTFISKSSIAKED